jgi:hypothetical protein
LHTALKREDARRVRVSIPSPRCGRARTYSLAGVTCTPHLGHRGQRCLYDTTTGLFMLTHFVTFCNQYPAHRPYVVRLPHVCRRDPRTPRRAACRGWTSHVVRRRHAHASTRRHQPHVLAMAVYLHAAHCAAASILESRVSDGMPLRLDSSLRGPGYRASSWGEIWGDVPPWFEETCSVVWGDVPLWFEETRSVVWGDYDNGKWLL